MRVVEIGAGGLRQEGVAESLSLHDGALGDHGDSVHPGGVALSDAVPVDTCALTGHLVLHIHDNLITFADLGKKRIVLLLR